MSDIKNCLPNFLIVGAAKCGTTSLYHYLKQHPEVFMPDWKEPSYFAEKDAGGVQSFEAYKALFEGAEGAKAIGEASTAYLYDPKAPERIKKRLGAETKIIILLRNPIDMAYSNWGHQKRIGAEALDFAEALEQESRRMRDKKWRPDLGWKLNFAYTDRALYTPQIQRYLEHFSRENLLVYLYEEFFRPGLPLYSELCKALKVDEHFRPDEKIYNKAGKTRFLFLHRLFNKRYAWKEPLKQCIPNQLRQAIKKKANSLNRKNTSLPPIDQELSKNLEKKFDQDVRELEKLLGRSLKDLWF